MSSIAEGSATVAYSYASELLQQVAALIAATDGGPIDRQYVSPGLPAIDCSTIAVWGTTLAYLSRTPSAVVDGGHTVTGARIPLFGFGIILARDCVPVTKSRTSAAAPTPEQLDAAARKVLEDVWAVWNGIPELVAAGSLFAGRCSELYMDGAAALETQGMTAGWQIQLRAALPGYIPGS